MTIDGDFIQPEGVDAVENLPEDIVDLSKFIPYKDLPEFFDSMATKIEDELLPDFKLKIAHLQRQVRAMQYPTKNQLNHGKQDDDQRTSISFKARELLNQCYDAWAEAEARLIRNGIDQCRAALRRLMDDRLYRKNKKGLNSLQRRRCRGSGILDARNLRMDGIEEAVEKIVHDLKIVADFCEVECQIKESEIEEALREVNSSDEMPISSEDEDPLDFRPISSLVKENDYRSVGDDPSVRSLPPFQQHRYAKNVPSVTRSKDKRSRSKLNCSLTSSSRRIRTPLMEDDDGVMDRSLGEMHKNVAKGNHFLARSEQQEKKSAGCHSVTEQDFADKDETSTSFGPKNCDLGSPRLGFLEPETTEASTTRPQKRRRTTVRRHLTVRNTGGWLQVPKNRTQSISQRMQAFLDANTGNGAIQLSEEDCFEKHDEKAFDSRHRRRRNFSQRSSSADRLEPAVTAARSHQNADRSDSTNKGSYHSVSLGSMRSAQLCAHIQTSICEIEQVGDSVYVEAEDGLVGDISNMSGVLSVSTQQMHPELNEGVVLSERNSSLKVYDYLTSSEGSRTIQELVATNDASLKTHVRVLCLCCQLIKSNEHRDLPLALRHENRGLFLDFLIAQLLDALYSVFLPSAWAIDGDVNRNCILHELVPLRDIIGGCVQLVESVSTCLLQSFQCQQWRLGYNGTPFVSSVDPSEWKNFLHDGTHPERVEGTTYRLATLGDVWPRSEASALCHILAFVGGFRTSSDGSTTHRWQLFSKLFSAGILASVRNKPLLMLPLCPDHINACEEEIDCFSALLSSGNMNPLPKADSMIVNFIQRILTSQAMTYELDETSRKACYPTTTSQSGEKRQATLFWRLTQPLYLASMPVICRTGSITEISTMESLDNKGEVSYRNILRPASKILCSCLTVIAHWSKHIPPKKARRIRFEKSVQAMCNTLLSESTPRAHQPQLGHVASPFESTFGTKPSPEIGNGPVRSSHFLKEATAYVRLILTLCDDSKSEMDSKFPSMVWQLVADGKLQTRQSYILNSKGVRSEYTGDSFSLFSNAKIMATTLCFLINVSPWHLGLGKSITRLPGDALKQDKESLAFVMSCIFACLDCLNDIEAGSKVFMDVYKMIVLIFQTLSATMRLGERSESRDYLKSICSFKFFPVLQRSLDSHLREESMSRDSTHIRLCLAAVRSIQVFLVTETPHGDPSGASLVNDSVMQPDRPLTEDDDNDESLWGGMDDAVFASLDLDFLSRASAKEMDDKLGGGALAQYLSDAFECSKVRLTTE
jgi:hypothetical protein